jgi:hypothetical protein
MQREERGKKREVRVKKGKEKEKRIEGRRERREKRRGYPGFQVLFWKRGSFSRCGLGDRCYFSFDLLVNDFTSLHLVQPNEAISCI